MLKPAIIAIKGVAAWFIHFLLFIMFYSDDFEISHEMNTRPSSSWQQQQFQQKQRLSVAPEFCRRTQCNIEIFLYRCQLSQRWWNKYQCLV